MSLDHENYLQLNSMCEDRMIFYEDVKVQIVQVESICAITGRIIMPSLNVNIDGLDCFNIEYWIIPVKWLSTLTFVFNIGGICKFELKDLLVYYSDNIKLLKNYDFYGQCLDCYKIYYPFNFFFNQQNEILISAHQDMSYEFITQNSQNKFKDRFIFMKIKLIYKNINHKYTEISTDTKQYFHDTRDTYKISKGYFYDKNDLYSLFNGFSIKVIENIDHLVLIYNDTVQISLKDHELLDHTTKYDQAYKYKITSILSLRAQFPVEIANYILKFMHFEDSTITYWLPVDLESTRNNINRKNCWNFQNIIQEPQLKLYNIKGEIIKHTKLEYCFLQCIPYSMTINNQNNGQVITKQNINKHGHTQFHVRKSGYHANGYHFCYTN